jgi:S-adenosylmethionine hydrolase
MSVITLLTDFGVDDEYVGVMKGVILSVNPHAVIVDITHHIASQDLIQTAYLIESFYMYFPKGTVHIIVVDPGVGGERAIIALERMGHLFLAPDNGVLTLLLEAGNIGSIVRLDNPNYFLDSISQTFHGRDIFAPVGAYLSKGIELKMLGAPVDQKDLIRLRVQKPFISAESELVGLIVWIDRFGNLITNIDFNSLDKFCMLDREETPRVKIGGQMITGFSKSYGSVGLQKPLAIIGSRGYLEIALNCGRAENYFGAQKGDAVKVIR